MTSLDLSVLLGLVLAHLIGDFPLQPRHWVDARRERGAQAPELYLHALVHVALSTVVLTLATLSAADGPSPGVVAVLVIVIGVSHALIDLGKARLTPDRLRWFLLDQGLHGLVLVGVWFAWLNSWQPLALTWHWLASPDILMVVIAYMLILQPMSIVITLAMQRWSAEISNPGTLVAAGARIGMLERFLILTLVLADQMTAIGFLLAAKSVLRFGELRDTQERKLTEYVLLGTLLSFSVTIGLGLVVTLAL
ncbi:DUF3307 domain-containing protein [Aidingimonas lacisalsi]|uniref:DUF3307 domain-containing protein n=1 Tax=Aidingimonas lacisalsi TaxID=2604086 RepID=UPI0011D1E2F8|nr:DUF3307 domain-containing protein [Aidingimonas lacisalsi]